MYDAGDIIYEQGDPSTHFFNLISGWVVLHCDTLDGRRQVTRFLQSGALFGMEPTGKDFSQTATAITTAVICPIQTKRFHDLRRSVPSLNEHFVSLLQRERDDVVRSMTSIALGTARERIGTLLWDLALASVGEARTNVQSLIPMPLTQRHIAEATGLTSIHVNRVLRQLREDRVLVLRDGRLHILDAARLRSIVELGLNVRVQQSEGARLGSRSG